MRKITDDEIELGGMECEAFEPLSLATLGDTEGGELASRRFAGALGMSYPECVRAEPFRRIIPIGVALEDPPPLKPYRRSDTDPFS